MNSSYFFIAFILICSCSTLKNKVTNSLDEQIPATTINLNSEALNPRDTIYIGSSRAYKSLNDYFALPGTKENVYLLVDEGTYYSNNLFIDAKNCVIEGVGQVNLYCMEFYENVMWLMGEDIVVKNFHMKHFAPGSLEGQNCSGRVIGFDGAHRVSIENCDLNGCGLAGLHDNMGNSEIFIKNNYIHNNSIGAYTDINGGIWFKEVDDHPVFHFENNRMENNGPDRTLESDSISDYILSCPKEYTNELKEYIRSEKEAWKNVPNPLIVSYEGNDFGDYHHVYFRDSEGKTYDFGSGNNDFGAIQLYYEDDEMSENPAYFQKQFTVYWEWKISMFPCCSGDYQMAEAFLPSIVRLEPIAR